MVHKMEEMLAINNIQKLYKDYEMFMLLCIMLAAFYPLLFILKKIISPGINKIVVKRNKTYIELLDKHNFYGRFFHVFSSLYLMFFDSLIDHADLVSNLVSHITSTIISVYTVTSISTLLITSVNISVELYKTKRTTKRIEIDLHAQIVKIFIIICAILSIISLVLGISIGSLFTSLGAAAALLTFVFKDTVLGLLASLQLTLQDIIRVGDWVTLPSYNADGEIEKITITVVVIRNFDATYSTVPTSAFLTTGVRNWRAMFEKGGRRIKRAISINMDYIKICNQESLTKYKKIPCMSEFAGENPELFNAKNNVTNMSMFRYYVKQYLRNHQEIHQEGFSFLVRQLDPTSIGIPLEIYVFTKDTKWSNYEDIQADIFDHIFAILPEFELRAYQVDYNNKKASQV